MIVLNEVTKPVGNIKHLRNIYSLGSFDPSEEYVIDVKTLGDNGAEYSGTLRLPVRSVGKRGTPAKFFFSSDLMFLSYPGYELVFPSGPIPLSLAIVKEGIGFRGSLTFEEFVVYKTPQLSPDEKGALSAVVLWAQTPNAGRFVLPERVREAIEQ